MLDTMRPQINVRCKPPTRSHDNIRSSFYKLHIWVPVKVLNSDLIKMIFPFNNLFILQDLEPVIQFEKRDSWQPSSPLPTDPKQRLIQLQIQEKRKNIEKQRLVLNLHLNSNSQ